MKWPIVILILSVALTAGCINLNYLRPDYGCPDDISCDEFARWVCSECERFSWKNSLDNNRCFTLFSVRDCISSLNSTINASSINTCADIRVLCETRLNTP